MISEKSVFISHNKADKEFARNLGVYLKTINIDVWFDEWVLKAGESITEKINEGLINSTHFIIIWSENANKSNWVTRELNSTLNRSITMNGSPIIIPIKLDCTELPALLNDILYIEFDGDINKLVSKLKSSIDVGSSELNYNKALVKKYNEMIYNDKITNSSEIFPYTICPKCGNENLIRSMATDYKRDDIYFFIKCNECNWEDWTQ